MTQSRAARLPGPVPVRERSPVRRRTQSRTACPRLSVVVVNYREWERTAALTQQLLASQTAVRGESEVVIVDNCSPPHPLLGRLRRLEGVSLRRWGRNRGFARAANEGIRLSRGDWLLLLNPDVTLPNGFLDHVASLTQRLAANEPRVGIVGFALRNPDGSPQRSAGPFPTLVSSLTGLVLPRALRKCQPNPLAHSSVDWLTGCCLLVRRACWAELGGFDRRYFLYYEDVDLCRRAWAAGWSVQYDPGLAVIHEAPLHGRRVLPHLRVITRHALLTYAATHWHPVERAALTQLVRLEACARQGWAWLTGDRDAAAVFGEMGVMASDLAAGRSRQARRRLQAVVDRHRETSRAS